MGLEGTAVVQRVNLVLFHLNIRELFVQQQRHPAIIVPALCKFSFNLIFVCY